ncbi:MAG: response regulator [Chloroflexota bacterium]|nr:response regulator [Chloroflexota bacterium]
METISQTILVVDDEESVLELERRVLEDAGYEVVVASNGEDALKVAAECRPDLVLLDVMLPDVDGITISRQMRKLTKAPIVLISGKLTEVFDKAQGLDLGADDYITKPVSPMVLVARVRAVLRRAGYRLNQG